MTSNKLLLTRTVAFALLMLLNGCALFGVLSYPEEHVVETGDTLYSIAWQNELDYRELAAWNGIKPPYLIRPGQVIQLEPPDDFIYVPDDRPSEEPALAVKTTPLPDEPGSSAVSVPGQKKNEPLPANTAPTVPARQSATSFNWRWPADGEVVAADSASGNPGIDIAGNLGQPIRAAAGGRVVYSGSGLRGYGQLVIVKHENNYLSAYGYNRRLLVRQGDEVHIGQPIAEMGEGPQRRPVLRFEIRQNGKSLNPVQILPAR